jgi:uncharacterized protein YdaU (DUF1376 family)
MYFYRFHINDYAASTAHLSNEQDLAYRRCLDWYYSTEKPLPLDHDWLAKRLRVEATVLLEVLTDMFERTEDGYRNSRAEEELVGYHRLAERNKSNGAKRKTQSLASGDPVGSQSVPSGDPVATQSQPTGRQTSNRINSTSNQTEENTEARAPRARVVSVEKPDEIPEELWSAWMTIRKAKRAPITEAALGIIKEEAAKANWTLVAAIRECVSRGWQGFKAEWVAKASSLGATPPPLNKFAKPVSHMSNMPLGTLSCECEECVRYRAKRMAAV